MTTAELSGRVWARAAWTAAALGAAALMGAGAFEACGGAVAGEGGVSSEQEPSAGGGGQPPSSGGAVAASAGEDAGAAASAGRDGVEADGGTWAGLVDAGWELVSGPDVRPPEPSESGGPDGGWDGVDAGDCYYGGVDPQGRDCSLPGYLCVEPMPCGPRCWCTENLEYECDYPDCAFQCPPQPVPSHTYWCHAGVLELMDCTYRRDEGEECRCFCGATVQFGVYWACTPVEVCRASE